MSMRVGGERERERVREDVQIGVYPRVEKPLYVYLFSHENDNCSSFSSYKR